MVICKSLRGFLIVSLFGSLLSCTSLGSLKKEVIPQRQQDSPLIEFSDILFDLKYESDLFKALNIEDSFFDDYKEGSPQRFRRGQPYISLVENVLRCKHFNVMRRYVKPFEKELDQSPRFVLSATVEDCDFGAVYGNRFLFIVKIILDRIELKVNWELYDTEMETVIFTKKINSLVSVNEMLTLDNMLQKGVKKSAEKLVADKDFKHFVFDSDTNEDRVLEPIILKKNSNRFVVETSGEEISKSVVMIRTGLGFGSGFVITDDGYIITAAHVVGGMDQVSVVFQDERWEVGNVVRINHKYDIALVKIQKNNLSPLAIAEDQVKVGNEIYCIGTPLTKKLFNTLTYGVVSNIKQVHGVPHYFSDMVANPGNSGGPAMNSSGQVIGSISTMLMGPGNSLISCIEINEALKAINVELK